MVRSLSQTHYSDFIPTRVFSCVVPARPTYASIGAGYGHPVLVRHHLPVDLQEVDNALNQARKEVASATTSRAPKPPSTSTPRNHADPGRRRRFKLNALWEIVQTRLVRRNVPVKNLKRAPSHRPATARCGRTSRCSKAFPPRTPAKIVKSLKDHKLQERYRRPSRAISSASLALAGRLQEAMRLLREADFGVALQFGNYRG